MSSHPLFASHEPTMRVRYRRASTQEWSRKYVQLDGKEFDPEERPWILEPMEYMDRVRGATFLIVASIQSGKSLAGQLFFARQMDIEPGRMLWYSKTDDAVKDFAREKWNPLIDGIAPLRRNFFDNPHKRTVASISLPFGHFQMLSAGVEMDRNSKSGRDIGCDEPWAYKPGELTEIAGRYSDFEGRHRFVLLTSGETLGSEVHEIRLESDQRAWHNLCPHPGCHRPINLTIPFAHELDRPGGLRFARGERVLFPDGRINTAALAETVGYECPHCRQLIPYSPTLQKRMNCRAHGGHHRPLNPTPKPRVHSWTWNSLVHMSWLGVAEQQLKAEMALARGDEEKIEEFVRKRAARPYDIREFVRIGSTDASAGEYLLSATPLSDALFHTLTIDVQQDHFWYRVRAWYSDVSSKLVACGKVVSSLTLRQIQHQYGIKDHGGDIRFDEEAAQWVFGSPCQVYLDGNYNPAMVRRLAASYNWCVLRGEDCKEFLHKDGFYKIYSEIRAIDAFEGTVHNGSRYVAEIRFSNNAARNRFALLRSIDAPKRLWTYAKDAGETYVKHLNAWVRVEKKNKAGITLGYEWRQVADRDDLFWCEKADIVVASMAGLIGVSDTAGKEEDKKSPDEKQPNAA